VKDLSAYLRRGRTVIMTFVIHGLGMYGDETYGRSPRRISIYIYICREMMHRYNAIHSWIEVRLNPFQSHKNKM